MPRAWSMLRLCKLDDDLTDDEPGDLVLSGEKARGAGGGMGAGEPLGLYGS